MLPRPAAVATQRAATTIQRHRPNSNQPPRHRSDRPGSHPLLVPQPPVPIRTTWLATPSLSPVLDLEKGEAPRSRTRR